MDIHTKNKENTTFATAIQDEVVEIFKCFG